MFRQIERYLDIYICIYIYINRQIETNRKINMIDTAVLHFRINSYNHKTRQIDKQIDRNVDKYILHFIYCIDIQIYKDIQIHLEIDRQRCTLCFTGYKSSLLYTTKPLTNITTQIDRYQIERDINIDRQIEMYLMFHRMQKQSPVYNHYQT